jgi:osmotically-inducible protein OsmY
MRRLTGFPAMFASVAAGALGEFFLDPENGKRRRHEARDRFFAFFRRGSEEAARKARYAEGVARGAAHEAATAVAGKGSQAGELDDLELAHKVETEIFRNREVPKGDINVNAENGVVYLRGQVEREELIEELVEATRAVDGVRGVESLLHVPGTPAPTKS